MLIYLIRHGETTYNAEKRYQGNRDIPLSAAGRQRLRRSALSPAKVYVTRLRRTAETAEILFPEAQRQAVPGLEEMRFGAFEGRNYMEMERDTDYRAWVEGGCEGRCPGGESRAEFSDRVCGAFAALVDRELAEGTEALVIVAHGGTQMAVLERFGVPEKPYYDWYLGNGMGYVLDAGQWGKSRRLTVLETMDFTKEG